MPIAPKPSPPSKPRPLDEDEISQVREIIEDRKWSKRFWTSIRTYALWITGVGAGATVALDAAKRLVVFLGQK